MTPISIARKTVLSLMIPILICATTQGIPSAAGGENEVPDFDKILTKEISPDTEKLRKMNETVVSSSRSWDESTSKNFEVIGKACSTANEKIESVVAPIAGAIGGAAGGVSLPLIGGLGFLGAVAGYVLVKGAEALYERIYHEKQKNDELNGFIDNLKSYEEIIESVHKVERKINGALPLMEMIRKTGGRSTLVNHLDRLNQHADDITSFMTTFIKTANLHRTNQSLEKEASEKLEATIAGLERTAADLRGFRRQSKSLIEALEASKDEDVCKEMRDGIASLFESELSLISKRKHLVEPNGLKGQQLWLDVLENAYEGDLGTPQIADTLKQNADKKIANAEARYVKQVKANAELKKQIDQAYQACLNKKSIWHRKLTFLALPATKKECKKLSLDPNSEFAKAHIVGSCKDTMSYFCKAKDEDIETSNKNYLALKDVKLGGNSYKAYRDAKKSYQAYFDKLVHDHEETNIRKRNQALEAKQEEIEKVCADIESPSHIGAATQKRLAEEAAGVADQSPDQVKPDPVQNAVVFHLL